jgi:hypothetical protein
VWDFRAYIRSLLAAVQLFGSGPDVSCARERRKWHGNASAGPDNRLLSGLRELRIEVPGQPFRNAWARVTAGEDPPIDPVNVEVRAFTKFLTGDVLNGFERKQEIANTNSSWTLPAKAAANHQYYFVNT